MASEIDKQFLNYYKKKTDDRDYNITTNGYEPTEKYWYEKAYDVIKPGGTMDVYGKDIGIGATRGVAKLGEGITSLVAAGAEEFILGPKSMEMLDPEGDGIVRDIGEFFKNEVYPKIGEVETVPGGLTEGVFQFLTPGVGYYRLFNGLIKAKGVWPFISRALLAETATVGTAQVPGDPNFAAFIAQMLDIDTNQADNIAKEVFNYLATPADVSEGYDADTVFEEKFKSILADAPLGPVAEGIAPLVTKTIVGFKKLFKNKPDAIQEINNKMNFSAGSAMNPDGPLAKQIEDGSFKYEFDTPDNPYKTPKDPLELAMTKEELIEGAKVAESGRDWYVRHKPVLNQLFGDDAEFFEELIGITSQQASVDENIERAMVAYKYFKQKGSFKDLEFSDNNELSLLKGVIGNLKRLDGSMDSATGKLAADKQIRERMGYGPTETSTGVKTYLAGNKVPDFVEAMKLGTDEVVTMDRHMIQIIFGKKAQVSKYNMAEGKKIVTDIANELGWTPKETQAAIWAFNQIRDHDITKAKAKGLNDVRDYQKALEDRADAIDTLVSEFSNSGGSSKSISTGSSTSKKAKGKKKRYIIREDEDLDTEDLYGMSAEDIDNFNKGETE